MKEHYLCPSFFALALFLPLSGNALAKCSGNDSLVFSCLTQNKKQIEVCDAGRSIKYSFGKPNQKPELALEVSRDTASTYQWQGVGRWASYTVEIPNGKTTYSVFWGYDRMSDEHTEEAGVHVNVNNTKVATVLCKNGTIEQYLDSIDLKQVE